MVFCGILQFGAVLLDIGRQRVVLCLIVWCLLNFFGTVL